MADVSGLWMALQQESESGSVEPVRKGCTDLSRTGNIKRLLAVALLAVSLALPALGSAAPQKGKAAPPLKVVTTSGQKVSLANYTGHVLVLEFFATWCEACKDSLPHMNKLNQQYGKQGLQILGLNPGVRGDTEDVVRRFIRDKKINFPVAMVDDDILIDYGVSPIPAIFIIDKKGVLVQKFVSYNDEIGESMNATIKTLLAK
jgi:cytochrome c biogenesis protein CcmG, thiol:disulfide interchange protein DsbE